MFSNYKIGYVISQNSFKTIRVIIISTFVHPRYKKLIKKINRFLVHDYTEKCQIGDKILISEQRPISKKKYFYVKAIFMRKLKKN